MVLLKLIYELRPNATVTIKGKHELYKVSFSDDKESFFYTSASLTGALYQVYERLL